MFSSRAVSFVIGVVGACLGVAAFAASSRWLGLVAGALALAAGVAAMLHHDDTSEQDEQLSRAEHELTAERDEHASTNARLEGAVARIAQLEQELSAAAASADDATPDDSHDSLVDAESELFTEAYFRVALEARIASARRHLRPVAVALLDVYDGLAAENAAPAPPDRAAASIRATIRDADTACRLDDGSFAVVLEDTPENGAVWTVERIRRNLVSRFGPHTMWAGVACYPAHAFSPEELLDQATIALRSAREWKQDRIEVAIAD